MQAAPNHNAVRCCCCCCCSCFVCQNHTRKLPLACQLTSLLSTIGGDLLVLSLRDRPDISDEEIRVIAEGCSQLREFDIG